MAVTLRILPDQFVALQKALLAASPQESFALGYAGWASAGNDVILVWRDFDLAPDDAYLRRGPAGADISPVFLARGVKRVRSTGEALVICHTHPFSARPQFSGTDDGGEDVLIPKVRDRAPDGPHGALVVGTEGASARVWLLGENRATSARLSVVGQDPTGSPDGSFDRQERALGPGTTATLRKLSVGIIGCGGLGWDIATLLAGHGIGKLTLVDPDLVESHNSPRLRLAPPDAVGRSKVDALGDLLVTAHPEIEVTAVPTHLADARARTVLRACDLLICATDNLASRLDADRFAKRLLVPLVDAGINVQVLGGRLNRVGGRVNVVWPTGPCLLCMGIFTPDDVAAEADPLGYRNGQRAEEAAVAAFNAAVAGLAASEALLMLLGARDGEAVSRYVAYDGLEPRVRVVGVPGAGTCGTCAELAGAVFGSVP